MARDHHLESNKAQTGAFNTEHWGAWLMAITALALGAIGLLRGFGLIGGGAESGDITAGEPGTQAVGFPAIWDSSIWLLSAVALGLLALALHMNDHHRIGDADRINDKEGGLFKTEHMLAYLMALATIVTVVLGIITGFDLLDRGNDQPDALPWLLAANLYGILTVAFHTVRHHQVAADESYIVRVVESRLSGATTTGAHATERAPRSTTVIEPGTERNR